LLQLRAHRLGFLQDGNVGIGILPENEEVLICLAALIVVTCLASASLAQPKEQKVLGDRLEIPGS
jgi:hypothetical protein